MLSLAIVYRPAGGRPLSLATIEDRDFLAAAAAAAIRESLAKAEELEASDPVLGRVQREDAEKLRRVLSALLPNPGVPEARVM